MLFYTLFLNHFKRGLNNSCHPSFINLLWRFVEHSADHIDIWINPAGGKASSTQGTRVDSAVQPEYLGALAVKDIITTADISATGSTSGDALLTRGGTWIDPAGGGDMFRAVYDPENKASDAYNMANFDEATNAPILRAAERNAIAANTADHHNHTNKDVLDTTTASFQTVDKTKLNGIAAGATANTGTVTSIDIATPTGFAATAAITTSGTITISYAAGYQEYTTAETIRRMLPRLGFIRIFPLKKPRVSEA